MIHIHASNGRVERATNEKLEKGRELLFPVKLIESFRVNARQLMYVRELNTRVHQPMCTRSF